MKELNLSLTIDETNILMKALGDLPFVQVSGLISKIHNQATVQLEAEKKTESNEKGG